MQGVQKVDRLYLTLICCSGRKQNIICRHRSSRICCSFSCTKL